MSNQSKTPHTHNTRYTHAEVREASLAYFKGDSLAADVFANKYALRDLDGHLYEKTPADAHRRLAREFARVEQQFPNPLSFNEILELFTNWEVVAQGSPMSAIGNPFQVQSASNCFVVASPEDSYGGLMKTDQEQVQLMKRRGGVGFDLSTVRPKNCTVANAARSTDGVALFMERFSNTCREVAQSGRRGALMLTLSVHHPDILDFINLKRDRTKVTGANVSVRVSDEFMRAVEADDEYTQRFPIDTSKPALVERSVRAKEVWDALVSAARDNSEPGVLFWDTVRRTSPADAYESLGFQTVSTNPCFVTGTLVATTDGPRPIERLVGTNVTVWDGLNWIETDSFRVTGVNQPLLKVTLADGSSEQVTPNHRCVLESGEVVLASELSSGSKLKISEAPLTHGTVVEPGAYVKGFMLGDGSWDRAAKRAVLDLHRPKFGCFDRLRGSLVELKVEQRRRADCVIEPSADLGGKKSRVTGLTGRSETLRPWVTAYRSAGLPDSVFDWDLASKAEFVAGLFDADAGVTDGKKGFGYQLTSTSLPLLISVQKLLKTMGVYGRVGLAKRGGAKNFGEARGGVCRTQDCWRLTVPQKYAILLAQACTFERVKSFADRAMRYNTRPRWNIVASVEQCEEHADKVYCATIPTTGMFALSSGNMWGNCGEITLCADDSCRLMAINLSKFVLSPFTAEARFDLDRLATVAYKAQRLMDDLVELELGYIDQILSKIDDDPETPGTKQVERDLWQRIRAKAVAGRRTGLGVTALGDAIAYCGLKYGSEESIGLTSAIYRALALGAYRSSVDMARDRGAFPIFDRELEAGHPYLERILKEDAVLRAAYDKHGRRNIACLTTAPTGSLSIQTQTTSGIEPVLFVEAERKRKINPGDSTAQVDYVDAKGDRWQKYHVAHHGVDKWRAVTGLVDTTLSPYHGATVEEINWLKKIDIQAAAQEWIDHSISNTTNLPRDVTVEEVEQLYWHAWKTGCKGATVYRVGSRDAVIEKAGAAATDGRPESWVGGENHAPKRPDSLPCDLHLVSVKGVKYAVIVGLLNGRPYEVFAGQAERLELPAKSSALCLTKRQVGNRKQAAYDFEGSGAGGERFVIKDLAAVFDEPLYGAFSRTVSLALRHGCPVQYLVEQLRKDRHSTIVSFEAAVARVLAKHYILDGARPAAQKACDDCGSASIAYQEGCLLCLDCGSSKCG